MQSSMLGKYWLTLAVISSILLSQIIHSLELSFFLLLNNFQFLANWTIEWAKKFCRYVDFRISIWKAEGLYLKACIICVMSSFRKFKVIHHFKYEKKLLLWVADHTQMQISVVDDVWHVVSDAFYFHTYINYTTGTT